MYKTLTISREFGSGGGAVARFIAEKLEWNLLDRELVLQIAQAAKVHPSLAEEFDEKKTTWTQRLGRGLMWASIFDVGAVAADESVFDAEKEAEVAAKLIRRAHEQGNCVVVGRGGQCVLQDSPDAFHAFVYAPWQERLERARKRAPDGEHIERWVARREREREDLIRDQFECERLDPHLYHLMVSSTIGVEATAAVILTAMGANV